MGRLWSGLYKAFNRAKFPAFLIIGAQKSGTTTLFDMLASIPGFCGSTDKEPGYFIKDDFYRLGTQWYIKQFKQCRPDTIKFEATPAYIYAPYVPQRISSFDKHMKFIVVLREPATRCYSAWNMYRQFNKTSPEQVFEKFVKHGNPSTRDAIKALLFTKNFPSFKQAVEEDIKRYESRSDDMEPSFVRRGIYFEQIANYLRYFSLGSFLFLEQRELNTPQTLLQKIADFLDMPLDTSHVGGPSQNNAGDYSEISIEDKATIDFLRGFYRPHNEMLFNQIGVRYDWNESVMMQ